jgi:hypothetical protein
MSIEFPKIDLTNLPLIEPSERRRRQCGAIRIVEIAA